MALPTWAYDTILRMKRSGESAYVTVARVDDLDGPSRTRESIEATHLRSPNQHKEFMPGLMDGGEVTFLVQFDPRDATHDADTGLEKAYYDRENADWQILTPIPGTPLNTRWGYQFKGHLTQMGQQYPKNGLMTQQITIKLSGAALLDEYVTTP